MTAPTPNAELAYRVLDHIDAHPEQWYQGLWIGEAECGTVGCFAGWTCLLSDVSMRDEFVLIDGEELHISVAAEDLLGLDDELLTEHGDPFDGLLTRTELGRLVEEIFGPRPHPAESSFAPAATLKDSPDPMYPDGELGFDVPPNAGSSDA